MTSEWIKIIASGCIGFVAACIVQGLSLMWQERTQKTRLRWSLYRELACIYIELRVLLTHLKESPNGREPSPVNFPEFVKADCYDTAKSSPLFWRLDDAFAIVEAHRNFHFLVVRSPENIKSATINLDHVLREFQNMIHAAKLHRRVLLKAADGRITDLELTVASGK